MSSIAFDIEQLYKRTFGSKPYMVPGLSDQEPVQAPYKITGNKSDDTYASDGSILATTYLGTEIWLPTILRGLPLDKFDSRYGQGTLFMPYAVVRITASSTIIHTPLIERRGTVKEMYSVEDYRISLRGFFIDSQRVFPIDELKELKKLHELGTAFYIDNALTNVFLDSGDKVVITSFDLPEVEGGRKHVRPFSLSLESDSVFTLEWNG